MAAAKPRKTAKPATRPKAKPAAKEKAVRRKSPAKRAKPPVSPKSAPAPALAPAPSLLGDAAPAVPRPVSPAPPTPEGVTAPGWVEVEGAQQEVATPAWGVPTPAVPASPAPPRVPRPAPAFDPATGDWIAVPKSVPAGPGETGAPTANVPEDAPDAPKKGTAYVLWSILLWIDLVLLGLNTLVAIVYGLILVFAPDSASADSIRDQLQVGSRSTLVLNVVVSLVAFGLIPVLWLLGTRRDPVEGTKRFLHLHEPGKGVLRGVLLTIPLLLAVTLLVSLYTLATEGLGGLTDPDEAVNPAVQEILDNLTWPIAILVAVGAGVGEEIFFRGFLQRYLGVWGQAVLFGLAHSTGGYVPQILFALALGVLFGLLIKRGWSLWSLIVAHTLYDFTLLAMALIAPESV